MKTMQGEVAAWLSPHVREAHDVSGFVYTSQDLDMTRHGYTRVGTASVAVTMFSNNEIVQSQVTALKAQIEAVKDEAQGQIEHLEGRIKSLQALTYNPETQEATV